MSELFGQGTPIDDVLAHYFPAGDRAGTLGQLVEDEQTLLLAALLMEARGEGANELDATDPAAYADYYARSFTATADGPPDAVVDEDGRIDLGFVAESVDLRVTDDVRVAFKPPNRSNRWITYRKSDGRIGSIPAHSRYVWIERAPSATSDPTVYLEGWA